MAKFIAAYDAWCVKVDALGKGEKAPREPAYRGPSEWELSLAEKRGLAITCKLARMMAAT